MGATMHHHQQRVDNTKCFSQKWLGLAKTRLRADADGTKQFNRLDTLAFPDRVRDASGASMIRLLFTNRHSIIRTESAAANPDDQVMPFRSYGSPGKCNAPNLTVA